MLTKNFIHWLSTIIIQDTAAKTMNVEIKKTDGTLVYIGARSIVNVVDEFKTNSNAGIWIGSGITNPSIDDYALESRITSGITSNSINKTITVDNEGMPLKTILLSLHNSSGSAITISEIGYFQNIYYSTGVNVNAYSLDPFCIDRTLLDTPVTIAAGDDALIKYALKVIFPSS